MGILWVLMWKLSYLDLLTGQMCVDVDSVNLTWTFVGCEDGRTGGREGTSRQDWTTSDAGYPPQIDLCQGRWSETSLLRRESKKKNQSAVSLF